MPDRGVWDMLEKDKRWVEKKYTNWVATLPCVNCGLDDETTVAHHLKHRHAPHGGGGMGLKANDFLTMPLCFECHQSAHSGDANILDFQADFIFKTLTKAFASGNLGYMGKGSVHELFLLRGVIKNEKRLFGEDLDD